jgi:hypothetical protein
MEGGLGDHLLANRFVAAIKEKHPDSYVSLWSDTEGSISSSEVLSFFWPNFYNEFHVIPNRMSEKCLVYTPHGEQNLPAHFSNIPEEYQKKILDTDIFYDLWIDGMNWIEYDFDWYKYLRFFPIPHKQHHYEGELPSEYVVCSLFRESENTLSIPKTKAIDLINLIQNTLQIPVVIPASKKIIEQSDGIDCHIVESSIKDSFDIISKAKFMFSIDSGLKYIAYSYGVPSLTFSPMCKFPHTSLPHVEMRWHPHPDTIIPNDAPNPYAIHVAKKILYKKAYLAYPLSNDIDKLLIKRSFL